MNILQSMVVLDNKSVIEKKNRPPLQVCNSSFYVIVTESPET